MEFTNWFFLPLILMTQLDIVGLKKAIAGALFVVVYTVCRMVLCVWVGIDFALAAASTARAAAVAISAFWVLRQLGLLVVPRVPPGIRRRPRICGATGKWWCPWFCQEEEREREGGARR